ncbi:MAG: F0F1 ATP synthase assembly protein I [Robiginitomaculum sp.]|nr:MAG: F0F1 ATP synthase assembly protein I [Robiginitomaculum sp.]
MGDHLMSRLLCLNGKNLSSHKDNDALEALGKKVKAAQDAHSPEIEEDRTNWAVGVRYASEFSAAVIVGGALGWCFDYFVGSIPWGMLVGIILGFTAGTRNIVRLAREMSVDVDES